MLECPDDQHEKTGRAESALQSMIFNECRLELMQVVPIRKPLDSPDHCAVSLMREHEAGSYRPSIHDHSTSTAHTVLATNMRTGKSAIVPDGVNQSFTMFDGNLVFATIYGEAQRVLVHFLSPSTNAQFAREC
jgi:hypothetical protein